MKDLVPLNKENLNVFRPGHSTKELPLLWIAVQNGHGLVLRKEFPDLKRYLLICVDIQ